MVLLAENNEADPIPHTLVIDGQQRIVTLSLFLAAIRDVARELDPDFAEHLHTTYLVNQRPRTASRSRPRTATATRSSPSSATAKEPAASPIRDAYRTFKEAPSRSRSTKASTWTDWSTSSSRSCRSWPSRLDAEDNPYRIFESLNAKGMPLTQGDLLRNYFFMRLPPAEHEHWYNTVWSPMQSRLGERFDDYMRDFLLKEGQPVRPDEVYQEWRKRLGPLDEEGIRDVLRELAAWSLEYDQILHPQREADAEVRKRLQRLTAWSKTVPYQFNPLLLRLHADYRRGCTDAPSRSRGLSGHRVAHGAAAVHRCSGARRKSAPDRAVRRRGVG